MDQKRFEEVTKLFLSEIAEVLTLKGREYTSGGDRLKQFKDIGKLTDLFPEQVAFILLMKHIISIRDLCFRNIGGYTIEKWDEKIGDAINYLLLINAIMKEDRNES